MILNEKNDFTFWIRYGISTNFGMIVLDYPKSEVTQYTFWVNTTSALSALTALSALSADN